jgi:uncharacterized membrane protein (UPF0127 family)
VNYLRLVAAAAVVIAAVAAAYVLNQPECGNYRSDKILTINNTAQLKAEVADSGAEKAKGLGGRSCIEPNQAMLFIFDKPGQYPFWMKDMKFPIDIVWIDANRRVVDLDIDVAPSTYPKTFVSESPILYVLELQANRSKNLGINLETTVDF